MALDHVTKNRVFCFSCQSFINKAEMTRPDGTFHTLCKSCRDSDKRTHPRRCPGWTDTKGVHHPCGHRTANYRCKDCWEELRADRCVDVRPGEINGAWDAYSLIAPM